MVVSDLGSWCQDRSSHDVNVPMTPMLIALNFDVLRLILPVVILNLICDPQLLVR
jgi:hypothetical protein